MGVEVKYTKIFINNEWVEAESKKTFETISPQTEAVAAKVAEGDKVDIDKAVAAAKEAFDAKSKWRQMEPHQRGQLLNAFADLIAKNVENLAKLETLDNGMPIMTAMWATGGAVDTVRYYAGMADKLQGDTLPSGSNVLTMTLKEPVGVCGLILPWNFPILMFVNKVSPALAAGCTVVVKPAEQTPLTALALVALVKEAGFPPGVVNVVPGYGPTAGSALTKHPDVAKISFTGSVEIGKLIQRAAGEVNLKRVTLELGGKSPLVVFDDADLNVALEAAQVTFMHQGQICIAPSRIYVQSGVYNKFVKMCAEHAATRKVGDPFDTSNDNGPQVSAEEVKKVMGYIERGKQEGGRLMAGGCRTGQKGYFIQPTVFADVHDGMTIAKEEIFGPVQSILKFDTLEEVIRRANDTKFGLAAAVITKDLNQALVFSKNVQAGNVWVNTYAQMGIQNPFGGFKDSGIGREGGFEGVSAYLETKTISIQLFDSA